MVRCKVRNNGAFVNRIIIIGSSLGKLRPPISSHCISKIRADSTLGTRLIKKHSKPKEFLIKISGGFYLDQSSTLRMRHVRDCEGRVRNNYPYKDISFRLTKEV